MGEFEVGGVRAVAIGIKDLVGVQSYILIDPATGEFFGKCDVVDGEERIEQVLRQLVDTVPANVKVLDCTVNADGSVTC